MFHWYAVSCNGRFFGRDQMRFWRRIDPESLEILIMKKKYFRSPEHQIRMQKQTWIFLIFSPFLPITRPTLSTGTSIEYTLSSCLCGAFLVRELGLKSSFLNFFSPCFFSFLTMFYTLPHKQGPESCWSPSQCEVEFLGSQCSAP
jgi:hypothetical protein